MVREQDISTRCQMPSLQIQLDAPKRDARGKQMYKCGYSQIAAIINLKPLGSSVLTDTSRVANSITLNFENT